MTDPTLAEQIQRVQTELTTIVGLEHHCHSQAESKRRELEALKTDLDRAKLDEIARNERIQAEQDRICEGCEE